MDFKPLNTVVFPGEFNLPLWAGIECGFFNRQGIDVKLHFTANSVQQLGGLINGDWEIGLTAFDNVVAYQEGQGEAAIKHEPDLFVFMGGDNAFLRLVVQANIRSYADLRGKVLSVDALTTGFAFVLRKMLSINGLGDNDVQFERAGGVMQRWEALKAGKHAGTLLLTPFELIAQKLGLRLLQSASEVFPHCQGLVGAARQSWAKANPEALVGFIRGYLDALAWLYDRANAQAACALLAEKVPNMSPELAAATYAVLLADKDGFEPKAQLNIDGIKTVLVLRSAHGHPQRALADLHKYNDLSYYDHAMAMH